VGKFEPVAADSVPAAAAAARAAAAAPADAGAAAGAAGSAAGGQQEGAVAATSGGSEAVAVEAATRMPRSYSTEAEQEAAGFAALAAAEAEEAMVEVGHFKLLR
jgi:hypothetical protein